MSTGSLSRLSVLHLAWPVVLAQAATSMTGVVDTIVMSVYGDKFEIGAVGVAAAAFGFIYWGFGFLRMSTTGLTAQANGAGRPAEGRAVLQRGLLLGFTFALMLIVLFPLLKWASFAIFQAEARVEELGRDYFNTRIWGAPALLMSYAINGWLLGMGRTRALLAYQIVLNGLNAGLDWYFVAELSWGPAGIGAGTSIAEWAALGFGLWLVRDGLKGQNDLFEWAALKQLLSANRDIMIRTLSLVLCFAWFVNSGAQQGTANLAGNEILLNFLTVAANVLDAFAFVTEKEVGEAYGSGNRARVERSIRMTAELAFAFGAAISVIFYFAGAGVINWFVNDAEARAAAIAYLPFCAAVPIVGIAAWQLDGVFIGATQGRALRTAGLISMALYIGTDLVLAQRFGNVGVWSALLLLYVYRAICLGAFWPSLMSQLHARKTALQS